MDMDPFLLNKIEQITNLPTLPRVASKLLKTLTDASTSTKDVAVLVGQDISLSAKILRLANSAFYGIPRTIGNISNAVVILGYKVIHTMVLSLTVFDMFPADKHNAHFDAKEFWSHCLKCGLIAKLLAGRTVKYTTDPEDAFCSGLLHDIGKIVMEQYLHDDFTSVLEYGKTHNQSFYRSETECLQFTHTDVAQWLIKKWDLPDALYFSIVNHHSPQESDEHKEITYICHYADYLSYFSENPKKGLLPPLDQASNEILGLSDSDISDILEKLPEEIDKTRDFYDIIRGKE